jgi:flagellar biosynthesis protein FlhF
MRLKSFYGPNMTEVMRAVREALGDNAIIVATRDDEMGGVRVTAAIEEVSAASLQSPETSPAPIDKTGSESVELLSPKALLEHQTPNDLAEKLLATATQFAKRRSLAGVGRSTGYAFQVSPRARGNSAAPIIFIGPPGAGKTLCAAKFATKATLAQKPVAIISADTERAGGMAQLAAFTRLLKKDMLETEDTHALRDAVSMQENRNPDPDRHGGMQPVS